MQLVEKGSIYPEDCSPISLRVVACPWSFALAKGAFLLTSADYRIGVEVILNRPLNRSCYWLRYALMPGVEIAKRSLSKPVIFFKSQCILAEMVSHPSNSITNGFLDKVVSES